MTEYRLKFSEQTSVAKEVLPTMYDLPGGHIDEPGLPDQFHFWQGKLLSETFRMTMTARC